MRSIHDPIRIALVVLVALLAGSCEHNDVLAPKDTTIQMSANPPKVVFDPANPTPVHVAVAAKLLDPNGYPKTGVAVYFSTTAGTLASGGKPIETDSASTVRDDLEVTVESPNTIDVTATSGTVSNKITLTKTVAGLAPSDGSMGVSANPATIIIDPNQGATSGVTQLTAQAFDKSGAPLANIAVRFRSTAGTVGSSFPVLTDTVGIALTTLTMTVDDPDTATVTASSSALSATADITKTEVALNKPPSATVAAIPANSAQAGQQVIFDGSASTDADGTIVNYKWTIQSDSVCCDANPPAGCHACANEVLEGPSVFGFGRIYDDSPQNLSVTLEVTDNAGVKDARIIAYKIECVNPAPVANAGPDLTQNASTSGQRLTFQLDGRASTDDQPWSADEVGPSFWNWSCGNGAVAVPLVAGDYRVVLCTYTAVAGVPNTWTATLTLFDTGSSGKPSYLCQKSSTDTALIKVLFP